MAPEILESEHGYAADWWSVGIILHELIVGFPPFTAKLPEKISGNILIGDIPWLHVGDIPWLHVPSEMSYWARDLIYRFLIHDPEQQLGANGSVEKVKSHPFFQRGRLVQPSDARGCICAKA
jgi:serine/threonine protein kinase